MEEGICEKCKKIDLINESIGGFVCIKCLRKIALKYDCGGYFTETTDGTDFSCSHGFSWNCEDCPIFLRNKKMARCKMKLN